MASRVSTTSAAAASGVRWHGLMAQPEVREARKDRDKKYEEGLKRTGMGNDAPGGAQFQGASKVVHPLMAESCVDFASRAMKELFPPDGPTRTKILGDVDKDKVESAERKRDWMNWQLTEQIEEFRDEVCARFPEIAALKPGIVRAGAAIGPHTGPKGLGVALIRA